MSSIPVLLIASLLGFAFLSTLIGVWNKKGAYAAAIIGMVLAFGGSIFALQKVLTEGTIRYNLGGWAPPFGIEYVMDNFSAFMAVIILFIGLIAVIYPPQAGLYTTPRKGIPMYGLIMLLIGGLVGVVVTGDMFNLFVFLEIYSLASYALITLGGDRATLSAFRYLILGTIAGSFYLLGVGFLYFETGSLNMADMAQILPAIYTSPGVMTGVAFIVIGMCIKMALFPLHVWLPDAHSYAPPVIAGILAAVQVETGAYVIIRLMLSVFQPDYFINYLPITTIIGWLSAIAILYGSIMAIAQKDFKRMLAYSTIAQVGYIGIGIGLATPLALIGGMLHILNHALMKSCLFLVAGGIKNATGLQTIARFRGLGRKMPLLMTGFAFAALSMVGIPPLGGFWSKWYLVLGSIDAGNWVFVGVLLASSLLTAVYFFRLIEKIFTTPDKDDEAIANAKEPSARIIIPILILAAGILVLGIMNESIVSNILEPITALLGGG